MTAWQEVRDLITERDMRGLVERVATLSEAERAEVGGRLPEFLKEMRETAAQLAREGRSDGGRRDEEDEWALREIRWEVNDAVAEFGALLRIAGAGTITGPAAAAAWLTRRELARRWTPQPDPADVVRVTATRTAAWRGEVARRLAGRIRTVRDPAVPLALALLRDSGCEPPEHDPLVVAWLSAPAVDDDPLIGPLLPRIFEAQGAGRALRDERSAPSRTRWLSLFQRLLASGRISRKEVLDGCVSRFLRGGDALDLRFFVRLHELVDPAPEEAAERARDYLRLLPAAPGPVAELALARLRRTGPHDAADTAEAIGALTFRAEAKLARTGLSWLDEEVRRAPERAGELAPALATAFAHASYDVQGRAAQIALKRAAAFGAAPEPIIGAVPLLPAALGARVAAAFGGEAAQEEEPEPFVPAVLPVLTEPGPFPSPALHPGERYGLGWVELEQWLAAFVTGAWHDRAALRETLAPVFGGALPRGYGREGLYARERWTSCEQWTAALAKEVIAPGSDPGVPDPEPVDPWAGASFSVSVVAVPADERVETAEDDGAEGGPAFADLPGHVRDEIFRGIEEAGVSPERVAALRDGLPEPPPGPDEPDYSVFISSMSHSPLFGGRGEPDPAVELRRRLRLPEPSWISPPHLFLLRRLSEIYTALRRDALPPVLLATPTVLTGHLHPDVLVDRLETCAAAGADPLAADLQQALLRLPRGAHPGAAGRAARVDSRVAAQAAAWLASGGPPDPETGVKWGYHEDGRRHLFEEREPRQRVGEPRLVPVLRAEPTGHDLIDELLREVPDWSGEDHGEGMGWWPSVLPSHREVVAVQYLPHLLHRWNRPTVDPPHLAALAEADGPLGDATALILAYFLAARHAEAVPLLLRMASRGDLPAEAVGRQLAFLIRRARFETRPVLAALAEAARRGAPGQVWEILRGMLPPLLPGEGERPNVTHSEAVALAADVAVWAGARGEIPVVSAFAASGRGSRFARECERLRDRLR
ncbi:hypothetical protein Ppa06_64240 [Planomonospora parontospora subsp. parontospora]|uniref:Secreted protein n=2 Tax=Planomonospora parontospora TaxID=58119 RepID=A0AA37F890_9ACTN|nr:DUF6493 family protein [Planomonospora parontospora]GGK96104.1 hypothetical protein GCM10010126_64410 [Planomonospora parontospora]GII12626.1 hypothetical protein Ppa06_64240 [Planomonospora parontospora subsp. parontospora]